MRRAAMSPASRWLAIVAIAALAGCSGDRLLVGTNDPQPPPPPTAQPGARSAPSPPPVDMAGRWQLASTAGGGCAMVFAATPGSGEGTIAPQGGCPGKFFTSRRWAYDQDTLIIRDHKGEPLARLAFSPPARFEGQAAPGETISLTK
jgi:Protease inhibitor Inh